MLISTSSTFVSTEEAERYYKDLLDTKAGDVRKVFITDVTGQQAVYLQKIEQAKMYVSDTTLPDNIVPYIVAEANARSISKLDAANIIIGIADFWNITVAPRIEEARIKYKTQLELLEPKTINEMARITKEGLDVLDQILIEYT